MLSSRPEYFDAGLVVALQQPEQLAGDDAAQAPLGVASGLSLSGAAGQVGASVGIDAQAHQQDGVQRAVELASPPRTPPSGGSWPESASPSPTGRPPRCPPRHRLPTPADSPAGSSRSGCAGGRPSGVWWIGCDGRQAGKPPGSGRPRLTQGHPRCPMGLPRPPGSPIGNQSSSRRPRVI